MNRKLLIRIAVAIEERRGPYVVPRGHSARAERMADAIDALIDAGYLSYAEHGEDRYGTVGFVTLTRRAKRALRDDQQVRDLLCRARHDPLRETACAACNARLETWGA